MGWKDFLKPLAPTKKALEIIDNHYQRTDDDVENMSILTRELKKIKDECSLEKVFGISEEALQEQGQIDSFLEKHGVSLNKFSADVKKLRKIQDTFLTLVQAQAYYRGGDFDTAKDLGVIELQKNFFEQKNSLSDLKIKYGQENSTSLSWKEGIKKNRDEIDTGVSLQNWLEEQLKNSPSIDDFPTLKDSHDRLTTQINAIFVSVIGQNQEQNRPEDTFYRDSLGNTVQSSKPREENKHEPVKE